MRTKNATRAALLLASLALGGVLGGCVAVAGGAMVGGTMMAVDRRTTGAQVDDQTIDLRTSSAIAATIGDTGHVNASSYNRVVLLTGEVPTDADRAKVEAAVAKVENVRAVVNEIAVMPKSSLGGQTNDTIITGKVKVKLTDEKLLQGSEIKVDTSRHVVTLRGTVLSMAARARAEDLAGGTEGVTRVINDLIVK